MNKNLVGRQFNNWLVISFSHKDKKRNYWICECQCEKKTRRIIDTYPLVHNIRKSCGCLPRTNITGQVFHKWKVLKYSHTTNKSYWECQCECGNVNIKRIDQLTTGISKDCGCGKKFKMQGVVPSAVEGEMQSRIASIWYGMHHRCQNPLHRNYDLYGGRGITICSNWYDYDNFKEWAKSSGYKNNLELDRIDNDGNYEPSNCRWVTRKQQCNNTSRTVYIKMDGADYTLIELSKLTGLSRDLLYSRYRKGLSIEKIISPVHLRTGKSIVS